MTDSFTGKYYQTVKEELNKLMFFKFFPKKEKRREHFLNDSEARFTLIQKPDKDITRK